MEPRHGKGRGDSLCEDRVGEGRAERPAAGPGAGGHTREPGHKELCLCPKSARSLHLPFEKPALIAVWGTGTHAQHVNKVRRWVKTNCN